MTTLNDRLRPIANVYADPVRLAAFVFGWWWVSNLIVGWWIGHDFTTNPVNGDRVELLFIPVVVNGWHLLVHGLTGVLGLACAASERAATAYCLTMAVTYVAFGGLGLAGSGVVTDLVAVDTFGSWVHIGEGVVLAAVLVLRGPLARPLQAFTGAPAVRTRVSHSDI